MREFKVVGKVYSKQRARVSTNKKTGYTHSYTPSTTVSYENLIRTSYMDKFYHKRKTIKEIKGKFREVEEFVPKDEYPIIKDAFAISITTYYGMGKSFSKKRVSNILNGVEKATKTPDIDNITKSVCDALNGVCYEDDKLCIRAYEEKLWSDTEEEYIVVRIYENPDELKVCTDVEHPDIYTTTSIYVEGYNDCIPVPIHLVWDEEMKEYVTFFGV